MYSRSLASGTTRSSPYAYSLAWPDYPNTVALHTGVALDDDHRPHGEILEFSTLADWFPSCKIAWQPE